jgi:predicted MFS family arabinose efflux permease
MSITVGTGQLGFAAGSTAAGFACNHWGFGADTMLATAFLLLTAFIVWRLLPEPRAERPVVIERAVAGG